MNRLLGVVLLFFVVVGGLITQAVFESWTFFPSMIWAVVMGPALFIMTVAGAVLVVRGGSRD